jgi:hypothetical protein
MSYIGLGAGVAGAVPKASAGMLRHQKRRLRAVLFARRAWPESFILGVLRAAVRSTVAVSAAVWPWSGCCEKKKQPWSERGESFSGRRAHTGRARG